MIVKFVETLSGKLLLEVKTYQWGFVLPRIGDVVLTSPAARYKGAVDQPTITEREVRKVIGITHDWGDPREPKITIELSLYEWRG